jgi:hypothetical protein
MSSTILHVFFSIRTVTRFAVDGRLSCAAR